MKRITSLYPLQRYTFYIAISFFLFSILLLWINHTYYHYPGGLYYHRATPWLLIAFGLIYLGCRVQFGKDSLMAVKSLLAMQVFLAMLLITLASNAVQFTPFEPIDAHIYMWDKSLHLDLGKLVVWTSQHPNVYRIMDGLYRTLPLQMTYIPLLLIVLGEIERVREYCFLLLITTFIGYAFYYFFPTIAPASTILGPGFIGEQYATGLKFYQIHKHISPSTIEGGMIALPSFHVIWLWLCAFLLRRWPVAFSITLTLNLVIVASCVCLGWHYFLDVMGSILVISCAHYIYIKCPEFNSPHLFPGSNGSAVGESNSGS